MDSYKTPSSAAALDRLVRDGAPAAQMATLIAQGSLGLVDSRAADLSVDEMLRLLTRGIDTSAPARARSKSGSS